VESAATNSKKRIPNFLFEHPLSCLSRRQAEKRFLGGDMANHLKITKLAVKPNVWQFFKASNILGKFSKS
jgi:hypothetical protein